MIARRLLLRCACLRSLCAVLGTRLHTLRNALGIECAADDVVTHAREIPNTTATDHNNAMLLQIVTDAGNVSGNLDTVGEADSGDLSERGVRLLRGSGLHGSADTALLGGILIDRNALLGAPTLQQCRRLRLLLGNSATCVNLGILHLLT